MAYVNLSQSASECKEYIAAVRKVQERLRTASRQPESNSLLNCLRFYTQEEQLENYFCLSCTEGCSANKIYSLTLITAQVFYLIISKSFKTNMIIYIIRISSIFQ